MRTFDNDQNNGRKSYAMTNIKKVPGRMPYVTRFKHLDQQRRNVQRALNTIPAGSDEQVAVSAGDTPAYLEDKIIGVGDINIGTAGGGPLGEVLKVSWTDPNPVDNIVNHTALATPEVIPFDWENKFVLWTCFDLTGVNILEIPEDATFDYDIGTKIIIVMASPTGPGLATLRVVGESGSPVVIRSSFILILTKTYTSVIVTKIGANEWHAAKRE